MVGPGAPGGIRSPAHAPLAHSSPAAIAATIILLIVFILPSPFGLPVWLKVSSPSSHANVGLTRRETRAEVYHGSPRFILPIAAEPLITIRMVSGVGGALCEGRPYPDRTSVVSSQVLSGSDLVYFLRFAAAQAGTIRKR
jgi:hypothetical protein